MTSTFMNYLGEKMDLNIAGGDFLRKITLFLWDKVGFIPKTKADFQLVVRILKNYVKLSDFFSYESNCEYWNLEKPDLETLSWLKEEIIPFFSKGLEITEGITEEFEKTAILQQILQECELMNFNKLKTEGFKEHWIKVNHLLEKLKWWDK